MKRPECEILDAVIEWHDLVEELEERLERAKAHLVEEAERLGAIKDEARKIESSKYAYWMLERVRPTEVRNALGLEKFNKEFFAAIGGNTLDIECSSCNGTVRINSRQDMNRKRKKMREQRLRQEATSIMCSECEEKSKARAAASRTRAFEERDRREAARIEALNRLPYREYLRTEEWQWRREFRLRDYGWFDEPGGYVHKPPIPCQNCDETDGVKLYHKASSTLGAETHSDILVLCPTCMIEQRDQNRLKV